MAQDAEVQVPRMSVAHVLVGVAALGTGALAALLLAGCLGLAMADDIQHGMPWNQLQPRVLMAAVMLIASVMLIMFHWGPGIVAGKDVWWERIMFASASVVWLLACQSAFGGMGA